MYELLKRIQHDRVAGLKEGQSDLRQDNLSLRNQFHTMQGDINNLRGSHRRILKTASTVSKTASNCASLPRPNPGLNRTHEIRRRSASRP